MRAAGVTALLVALLVGPIVIGAASGGAVAAPANNTTSDTTFTVDELRRNGPQFNTESVRLVLAERIAYWLEYRPAGQPWGTSPEAGAATKLAPGELVETNTVYLKSWVFETRDIDLTIVYWELDSREVTRGNATTSEPVARNVTVVNRTYTLEVGRAAVPIDLRRHDRPVRVTMWVTEHPDQARWTFRHQSVATTRPINVQTWGDFIAMGGLLFFLPTALGSAVAARKVRQWMEVAKTGPQWGLAKWVTVIGIVTGIGGFVFYTQIAEAIVAVPVLASLALVGVVTAFMLTTHERDIGKALLLKPDIKDAQSFIAEDERFAHDVLFGEAEEKKIARDEGLSFIREGLAAFWARRHGARSRIRNAESLETRIELTDSEWDEVFIVDPEAEASDDGGLAHHEPEGWRFTFADDEDGEVDWRTAAKAGLTILVPSGLLGSLVFLSVGSALYTVATAAAVGAFVTYRYYLEPKDGFGYIDAAPVHFRQAYAAMMVLAEGNDAAKTIEGLRKQVVELEAHSELAIEEQLEEKDATLVEVMQGRADDGETASAFEFIGDGNGDRPQLEEVLADDE